MIHRGKKFAAERKPQATKDKKITPFDRYLKEKDLTKTQFNAFIRRCGISENIALNIIWFHGLSPDKKLKVSREQAFLAKKAGTWKNISRLNR